MPSSSRPPERVAATHLSEQEAAMLANLMDESASVEIVQDKLNPGDLWGQLNVCCRAFRYVDLASARLKPIIGRILVLIQESGLWQEKGYVSFDDFLRRFVQGELGISRSIAFECKRLAVMWPAMDVATFSKIGSTKLNLLSRFTNGLSPGHAKYLKQAEALSYRELVNWAETEKLIESGEAEPAVLTIVTNSAIKNQWHEFCRLPEICATVGSTDQGRILEALMQECLSPWMSDDNER